MVEFKYSNCNLSNQFGGVSRHLAIFGQRERTTEWEHGTFTYALVRIYNAYGPRIYSRQVGALTQASIQYNDDISFICHDSILNAPGSVIHTIFCVLFFLFGNNSSMTE